MIGDSTMANKDLRGGNTERGWGHVLPGFLPQEIEVANYAMNGRSSKSFRSEGIWQKVYDRIKPGDYVFIQFGHNDQKTDEARYSEPETTYKSNLKEYIRETQEKGGIPVLFTSIARRKFDENGEMMDTHGRWIGAMKEVAAETGVKIIDMNARSIELIKSYGVEDSKRIFNHVAPKTQACRPEGKEDDTHFSIHGARELAKIAIQEINQIYPELGEYFTVYDYVVAKDGSGQFFTLQDAIDAVPDYRKKTTTIYVKKGVYKEKVVVPFSKSKIKLIGEDVNETVLTYDDFAKKLNVFGEEVGTSGSSSFYLYASDFSAENITFENSAGPVGQAVAILITGDRAVFKNCRFLGHQDTLYVFGRQDGGQSRQYFEECYIEGTVDFIFGWATSVFERCTIHSKANGYLTAASTPENQKYGYLFVDCKITSEEGVKSYLGRPWRPFAKTVFVSCDMDESIRPEGWHNWSKKDAEKTTFYAEFNSKGAGAQSADRVKWAKKMDKKHIAEYTVENVLKGTDNWNPKAEEK